MMTFAEWFQNREKKGYTEDIEAAWNEARLTMESSWVKHHQKACEISMTVKRESEETLKAVSKNRDELIEMLDGKNKVIKSQQEWMNSYFEQIRKLETFAEMVEDNTKMPHQHSDPVTRLYCLSERACEVLRESRGLSNKEKNS